jgi:hypothetical protein
VTDRLDLEGFETAVGDGRRIPILLRPVADVVATRVDV